MPPRPVLDTLERLWTALERLHLPVALVGGLALSFWRHTRATQDVDVLVGAAGMSTERLTGALMQAGFRPRQTPAIRSLGSFRVLQLEYEPPETFVSVHADLLIADTEYQRASLDRRVAVKLPETGAEVFVLPCEDMILHKLLAGRMIDLADAAALLRVNRDALDESYLDQWAGKLGTFAPLERARREAFGGESKGGNGGNP
jgi:hypothetical protein